MGGVGVSCNRVSWAFECSCMKARSRNPFLDGQSALLPFGFPGRGFSTTPATQSVCAWRHFAYR